MERLASSGVITLIDRLVQDETRKRQYYRPIYSVHKWWARRPGALFRSLILLAARPSLKDTLLQAIVDTLPDSRSPYFQSHDLSDVVILDPFMGGGTTLVEANRLGVKVIGCDINPVAFWTVKETLKPISLERLDAYFHQLESSAGATIRDLYRTKCLTCGEEHGEILYAFWVRSVHCPACNEEVLLFKRSLLNEGERRTKKISPNNRATAICPNCLSLILWDGQQPAHCDTCGHSFNPRQGTYDRGKFTCPHCQQSAALIPTLKAGQVMQEQLVALEYWCPVHQRRYYKAVDAQDKTRMAEIERRVKEEWDTLRIPKTTIPVGSTTQRWRAHGYHYYHQVFNARQLLSFHILLEAIAAIPEKEYREAFLTIFSNILEYNNMMTPYNYPHRKLHHLFTYHAMPLTTTPVENSVWGLGKAGAGTFANGYRRYRNAKHYAKKPYEKYRDAAGKILTVYPAGEYIAGNFVSSFEELLKTDKGALLFTQDSSSLPEIPDGSVDFVITDPPYYDNIHYSELSNFFYVWLRLMTDHPAFQAEHVPTDAEAIVDPGQEQGEAKYKSLMTGVFNEAHRVLKEQGRLIFTFHHTNPRAWWVILAALGDSGFQIVDNFPIRSEYKVNPHVRGKQALNTDMIIVAAKRPVAHLERELPSRTDPTQRFMDNLGNLLIELSGQWEKQPVLPAELTEHMTTLWMTLNDSYASIPASHPAPVAQQLRLLEKSPTYSQEEK